MTERKKIGELLVEIGIINEKQLQEALDNQQKLNMKLGQYLVYKGYVSETIVIDALCKQSNIERYIKNEYPIDMSLSGVFSPEAARKYKAVPIRKKASLLTVATTDPFNLKSLDQLESETNCEIKPIICSEQEFNFLTDNIYGIYSGLGKLIDDLESMQFGKESDVDKAITHDVAITALREMDENAPVIKVVSWMLYEAICAGASDIHISPEKNFIHLRIRVDGKLHEIKSPPRSMHQAIISRFKILANMDISTARIPQDGRFTVKMYDKEINVRVSTVPSIHGEKLVLRLLDVTAHIYSLEYLGMSTSDQLKIRSKIHKPYGMILSTGPTGSGKSTTLYSILKEIMQPHINIVTLEDPVEYRVEKICQIQLNRKAGMTFASGLRSILRQDPDVIMVGEIRDGETASVSVQAAMTGHLVLSTVHTNDASSAITRFVNMGIEPFYISSIVLLIFAQRLVRKVCPYCRESYIPSISGLKFFEISNEDLANLGKGKGCMNCKETGYLGRTGIFEVLIIDEMVQEMIADGKTALEIKRKTVESGLLSTLKTDARNKIINGITTLEEGASVII
ncbi:MAG: Flp pilus assembly complex ATPase component TadA [Desulfobacterales bacterium]|nr:Flp pilus assembly complex ATPase component TadA [Desulfobacterales bacterium]